MLTATAFTSEIKSFKWWVRAFDFPKLQIVWLYLGTFVGALYYSNILAIIIMIPGFIHTALHVWPYLAIAKNESKSATNEQHSLSLVMSNVQMENQRYDDVLTLVQQQDADLVLLIETNSAWHQAMRPLKEIYPHHIEFPNEVHSGMLLYCKHPLQDPEVRYLVKDYIPSIRATIKCNNQDILFYAVHPRPPRPENSAYGRDMELWTVAQEIENIKTPIIVAGDLNDVGWSDTTTEFREMSGLQDPRRGRGFYNSYNANHFWARWPLDHLFHSHHFAVARLKRLEKVGSDHFPLLIKLQY